MSNSSLRVLIVDDNSAAHGALRTLMEVHGRAVRTAATGPEALTAADEFHPDVVLLDLALPGMSGYEVAEQLRARPTPEKVRIIAVTGYAQPLNLVWSQQTGFEAYLIKPVDPAELERILQEGTTPAVT